MYNTNQMYGTNPYYGYNMNYQQPIQNKSFNLQGKVIDNLEVVKGTDILLDGSVNYFPLADGSAIATKQLQPNGTSRIIIYKPVIEEPVTQEPIKEVNNIPENDFSNDITKINEKIYEIEKKIDVLLKKSDIEKKKENK